MWNREQVEQFVTEHPIDTSWRGGYQIPKGETFSVIITTTETDGYGTDKFHEVRLTPNLRHCPQHTLLDVLDFMQQAVHVGDVEVWNHPNGTIRIQFTEEINPGP